MSRATINILSILKRIFNDNCTLKGTSSLALILFFVFNPACFSQEDLVFDHITVTEGLTQGLVNKIFRDSRDFMWFGTLQGINRYDGINIKKFESLADDSTTVTSGIISVIFEDSKGNLWVGTANGLNLFDYGKEKFIRYCHNPQKANSLPDNSIVNISEDSEKRLWVITRKGINLFRPESNDFQKFDLPPGDQGKDAAIDAAFYNRNDTIFFYCSGKVFQFYTLRSDISEVVSDLKTKEVNTLLVDHSHNIWIGTENDGAYRVSKSRKTTHFCPGKKDRSGIRSSSIKSIDQDSGNNIWLSTRDGLYRLNPDKETFFIYQNEKWNPNSLLSSYSRTFYEDKQGIIWIGTVGGVNKFNPERLRFRHLKTSVASDLKEAGSLYSNDNIIWSFYQDNNDLIWIGSMRILLSYAKACEINKGIFHTAVFKRNGEKIIPPFNSVLEIKGDRKNNLWLGTDNGLYYYNTHNSEIKGYLHLENIDNSLPDNIITSIVNCGDSVIWIGTTNGLSRFEPSKDQFINYYHNPADNSSLVNNLVNYLFLENDKKLWVAGLSGISCIDITQPGIRNAFQAKFLNMRPDLENRGKSFNEVLSIIKYHDGNYWMGTDNGLFLMDPSMRMLEHYNVKDGLPNKIVNQVQEDSKGHLWISTENGLSCFDHVSKTFRNFSVDDGIQSGEFNSNSSLVDKNGLFYFGGINGFNVFNPDSVKISKYSPKVVISNMTLFNNPVIIDKAVNGFTITRSIYETKEINLNYNQNFFSFDFAAIDYTNPAKIQYEYMLEGLDETWIKCNNNHSANYTNVKPGKYLFKARATNSDGVWSNNMAEIKVVITPPFWKTWIFYAFSLIILALLVYTFYRFRINNLEKDKRLLEEEVQKRTHEISVINQDLKKSKSFIESVITNATYGIMVVDQQGNIIIANPAVSDITGYTNQELISMNFRDLTPRRWQKSDMASLDSIGEEESTYIEKEYIRKDGSIIQVSVSTSYIKDYDVPAFVNIITDITSRVANEKEIQEHRTNLEALVKERTADLITAKERAEKADRLKTAFLSNISHEIRTPMNAIIGFSNLIKEHAWEPKQMDEFLNYINEGAHNLLDIVTDIVEISKIAANDINITLKSFDFLKFLNDIMAEFSEKAKLKGLDFIIETKSLQKDIVIISDEAKLSVVLHHLLDNAIKFTQTGNISLDYSISDNDIAVCVKDTGIGISPEIQDDIFEPFKQAESNLSRAYGGTGLGLSISRAYIEKLGGKLWVDSVQGEGSKFCFSFPLTRSEDHLTPGPKGTGKFKNLNILIVEDEEMNFRYLAEVLKNKAENIYHAIDGFSAIEQCRNNPKINMVLMDIKLPGINGLEATSEIKKFRPDLPVIAQTAYTLIGDREKALEAGCDEYISKPIDREKLFTLIRSLSKE
jgi:PAS domain S-box-containing protein